MHKHNNGLKTAALFGVLWAVLLGLGAIIGAGTRSTTPIWIFALIGVATTAYGYWNSDKIAIRSMAAYPVSEAQAPQLYQIVRELSVRANKPMPRIYLSPTMTPNAFATGRSPKNAAVCCTEGILHVLDARELRGVLGHELMHVYNRDILTSSVAAAVAGVITSVGQMLLFFGGGDRRNANPLAMIAMALLAPFAALTHSDGDLPHPGVRRRRGRCRADRRPTGARLGAAQDRIGRLPASAPTGSAARECLASYDRQSVPWRWHAALVLHAPAHEGAHHQA
ncbi:hypothetical protein StoSoilB13_18050 [Arthrobacter sp. StoSoilB13]|nr:hypothetical protein StoSoilB13_18050 [Arthrobacter sp. StoSoilB13]